MEVMNARPDMVMCRSGQPVWFQHPHHTKLSWEDLDVYLVNLNRYNGGIEWNLAQHHWLCHDMAEHACWLYEISPADTATICAELVVHDIHETTVGDVVAGLKPLCPDYKKIENIWEDYYWEFLYEDRRQRGKFPRFVKDIDSRAVLLEAWWGAKPLYDYFIQNKIFQEITNAEKALVGEIGISRGRALKEMKERIASYGGYIGS